MAAVLVTTTMAGAINYTYVTDTSADWASVPNSIYFYDKADKLVHYKNGSGSILEIFSSAGGLTYFTEDQNTSAPNATVYVDSLTAIASTTDADISIVPKGAGAFSLAIANSLTSGGNKRGANSVDLQTFRGNASQVASGSYSVVIGTSNTASSSLSYCLGSTNTASNTFAVAIGYQNIASGNSSIAMGNSCTASGSYSAVIGGLTNTATGQYGVTVGGTGNSNSGTYGALCTGWQTTMSGAGGIAGGYTCTHSSNYGITMGYGSSNSGSQTFVLGQSITSSDQYSIVVGSNSSTTGGSYNSVFGKGGKTLNMVGRLVLAYYNTTVGDAQNNKLVLSRRTTDDTLTPLTVGGGVPYFGQNEFTLQDNSCVRFNGTIVGKQTGTSNIAVWDINGVISKIGTVTININNVNVVTNPSTWGTPTLTVNGAYGMSVNVIGKIATNIQWTAYLDCTEVVY